MESDRSFTNKKILITCGPVWTRIDPVRVISNTSSGELGHILCALLSKKGAKITMLQGPVTHPFRDPKVRVRPFTDFQQLSALLTQELTRKRYDIVIHAAAVCDYQVKKACRTKISSGRSCLRLDLVPTPKLINRIKKIDPNVFLVGFKLQTHGTKASLIKKAQQLIAQADCDLVLANKLMDQKYCGYLLDKQTGLSRPAGSRSKIAQQLINLLKKKI